MEWFDYIWETKSEKELKYFIVKMKNVCSQDVLWSMRFALETKVFWFQNLTNLRRVREKKGITINQLAKKSGVSIRQIKRLEKKETNIRLSHADTVIKLAEVLKCGIADILEPPEGKKLQKAAQEVQPYLSNVL